MTLSLSSKLAPLYEPRLKAKEGISAAAKAEELSKASEAAAADRGAFGEESSELRAENARNAVQVLLKINIYYFSIFPFFRFFSARNSANAKNSTSKPEQDSSSRAALVAALCAAVQEKIAKQKSFKILASKCILKSKNNSGNGDQDKKGAALQQQQQQQPLAAAAAAAAADAVQQEKALCELIEPEKPISDSEKKTSSKWLSSVFKQINNKTNNQPEVSFAAVPAAAQ
ncbi:LOW QUALITY PROTEIN: hypothetical protein, conserved [Eimeria necatrix]|uniref:Uncharacterized protein n=1 Tax=Eimeria necatrix TaxID=51315 RepID=U6MMD0_9EIME|nr:LOW QUALITY PROTEIN: hypothetical protein, conserved [Eimeria necatrix]CDJ63599.1 hypothetical protein, conserved [Eimeria necatrix]